MTEDPETGETIPNTPTTTFDWANGSFQYTEGSEGDGFTYIGGNTTVPELYYDIPPLSAPFPPV